MRSLTLLLLCWLGVNVSHGQFSELISLNLATEANGGFGNGASFVDFNQDGFDDLTICSNTEPVKFLLGDGDSNFEEVDLGIEIIGDAKQPLWVDVDNDGDPDFFCSVHYGPTRLFRNEGNMTFTDVSETCGIIQTSAWRTHGASFADYDKDGDLDVYICNYNVVAPVTNYLYQNNGDGTFIDVTDESGLANGHQDSFDCTWLDHNGDGWLDLYLINDREPWRNYLYINQQNGIFEDKSLNYGFDHWIEAMCITPGDYDNDGDFDIYIANSYNGNLFLHKQGLNFMNISPELGTEANSVCWGSLFVDYNNDMWQDLYSANYPYNTESSVNNFYVNDQNGGFVHDNSVIDNEATGVTSPVLGDVNNDGYPDIFLNSAKAETGTLLRNNPGTNNWLKVAAEGSVSNRDGIGTLIELYAGGIQQVRHTYCGTNYMGQDSRYVFFGMAELETADSLLVKWPSGFVDKFYDVPVNDHLWVVEGETYQVSITHEGILCEGNTITLGTEGAEYESILWNTTEASHQIEVNDSGNYAVMVTHESGVMTQANITIELAYTPVASFELEHVSCNGFFDGSALLDNAMPTAIDSVIWNGDVYDETYFIYLAAGTYDFTLIDVNGCTTDSSLTILQPDTIDAALTVFDADCYGGLGSAEIEAWGGTGELELVTDSDLDALEGGMHNVLITDENACALYLEFEVVVPEVLEVLSEEVMDAFDGDNGSITLDVTGGTPPYYIQWSNGQTGETAINLGQGTYTYVITDDNDCIISGSVSLIDTNVSDETSNIDAYQILALGNEFQITALKAIDVSVYSSTGQLIDKKSIMGQKTEAFGSNYPTGIFYIRIETEGASHLEKVFVP